MIAGALTALVIVVIAAPDRPADAADGETAQLISYFNGYRAQQGVGALSTSSTLNASAQAAAQESVDSCSFQLPSGTGKKWGAYAYPTAAMLWQAYLNDPDPVLTWIGDSKYHSVGVGRAYRVGCNLGHIWIIILDTAGGGSTPAPTPTNTPSPTPTVPPPSLTPTGSPGGQTPTPTNTTPGATETPTPTATEEPTATLTPEPSEPANALRGDVNCNGTIDLFDGLEVLKAIGGALADAQCLTFEGLDCLGGINAGDALAVFLYLGGVPMDLPAECPPIGAEITPTPGPSESATPTPTVTPDETSSASPSPTTNPDAAMDHCWLAPIAYDMTYPWQLDGDYECAPVNGAAYSCNFPSASNAVECTNDTVAHYSCYVWSDPQIDVPCASSLSTDEDYLCHRGETAITCTADTSPTYVCTVEGQLVTCSGPASFTWTPTVP
ncbi:MAG: CAP domain-containing protein [Dehalococcoidia bacterium]